MKNIFAIALVCTTFLLAQNAYAFTVVPNAQCVGGTLIDTYYDVQDGGGISGYNNAELIVRSDCAMRTPQGACCSAHVSTNGGGTGGAVIPYTWFSYKIYQGGVVQGGYDQTQDAPCLANQPGCSPDKASQYGRQRKYFAGPGSGTVAVTASLVANPTSITSGETALLTWSSTGTLSCSGNFPTGGKTSGSATVSPGVTTEYTVTCVDGSAPAQTAIAKATVTVSDGSFQVSCRAHPTRASIREDVLWASTVSGPVGTYTYAWSGTDGLSGVTRNVLTKYFSPGEKRAQLTVTYSPFTDTQAVCVFVPKGAPYYTKICSGGDNSANIQVPTCTSIAAFPSGDSSHVGTICKEHEFDEAGACVGTGTIYGNVQDYICGDVPVLPPDALQPRSSGRGVVDPPLYLRYWNTLTSFLMFDRTDPQFMDPNYVETVQMIETTVKGAVAESITVQCENSVTVGGAGDSECSDGIDNDDDGDTDNADRGCTDSGGTRESGPGEGAPQCADGIDNNGDGNIDWPDDPGCSSDNDNLELVPPAELTFEANPPLIKKNQSCTLTLSALSVRSCTLTGPGVSRSFTATNGIISLSEVVTPTLSQTSTYKLSCVGLNGRSASKEVDCKIAPTFEEI